MLPEWLGRGWGVLTVVTVVLTATVEQEANLEDFTHFKNLDEIKEFFENDLNPYAKEILESFEKKCLYMEDPGLPPGRRRPFIVIDGNHRACKPFTNVVGMKLSRKLGGRYLSHPAPCLHDHFKKLSQGTLTRRAFYLLSIYAIDLNVRVHINLNRPVILNGHWLEQVTFPLLQSLREDAMLPASSDLFTLPGDLLAPDLVIYLDTEDNNLTLPHTAVIKRRSVKMYEMLASRYPITIQRMLPGPNRRTIEQIYSIIRNNLSDHLDFRHTVNPFFQY